MNLTFSFKIGNTDFTIQSEVASPIDFFKAVSFYQELPQVGPNGETDLQIRHRTTKEGYEYFSIVCPSAGMEYKFGQSKEQKGGLFSKGWAPAYSAGDSNSVESVVGGLGDVSGEMHGLGGGLGDEEQAPIQAQKPVAAKPAAAPINAAKPSAASAKTKATLASKYGLT